MLVDNRELRKRGPRTGSSRPSELPIVVPPSWKTRLVTLETGDYTILGMKSHVCVELKRIPDLFKTFTWREGKARIAREFERAKKIKNFYLFIQGTAQDVLNYDGKYRGRSNNRLFLNYLFSLSIEHGFGLVFSDTDSVVAGKVMSSLLWPFHELASKGKIRVYKGPRYNV